jgi:tetratricopeptide (TPR) repeat protein
VTLDPLNVMFRGFVAGLLFCMGRYEDALAEALAVREIDPTYSAGIGVSYFALGRHEEAIAIWEKNGAFNPDQASALRSALSQGGTQGYVRELLRLLRE